MEWVLIIVLGVLLIAIALDNVHQRSCKKQIQKNRDDYEQCSESNFKQMQELTVRVDQLTTNSTVLSNTITENGVKLNDLEAQLIEKQTEITRLSRSLKQAENWYMWIGINWCVISEHFSELPETLKQDMLAAWSDRSLEERDTVIRPMLDEKVKIWSEQHSLKQAITRKVLSEAVRDLWRLADELLKHAKTDEIKSIRDQAILAMLYHIADFSIIGLVKEEEPWNDLFSWTGWHVGCKRNIPSVLYNGCVEKLHRLLADLQTHRPDELMVVIDNMSPRVAQAIMRLTISVPKTEPKVS